MSLLLRYLFVTNQTALHILLNTTFHGRTKHIKVDCHFVHERLLNEVIKTCYVKSKDQLANLFIKSLGG